MVSGWSKEPGRGECGTYGIDPKTGRSEAILIGTYPSCGGAAGDVSPNGQSLLSYSSGELRVVDLRTGRSQLIGMADGVGTWSPDGKWIAALLKRGGASGLVLVDAMNIAKRRMLGRAPTSGYPVWSPDSRQLLLERSQSRCGDLLSSLEAVDVESGTRVPITSSSCEIYTGVVGWVDSKVVPISLE